MNLDEFEMQLVNLYSTTIWKEKFVLPRNEMEEIERDKAVISLIENTGWKILKVRNTIPENYFTIKIVALAILSIFSSTYWCVFFSEINFIKPDLKNRLTEECSATCTLLKVTSCKSNMNELASNVQQKSHHTTLYTNHTYLLLSSSHKLVYRVY